MTILTTAVIVAIPPLIILAGTSGGAAAGTTAAIGGVAKTTALAARAAKATRLVLICKKVVIGAAIGAGVGATGGTTSLIVSKSFPLFLKSIDKAAKTGILVGLAISLGLIFSNQTLSFVGYSLGAEIVKSCILTLKECGADHVVHDIVFFGGLTSFQTTEEETDYYS